MIEARVRHRMPPAASPGLVVWAFAFVGFAGTTLLAAHPLARAAGVVLFGIPVVAWVVARWRRPVDRLDIAILVGIAAHLVVSVTSQDVTASLEMSAAVVAYAGVYWFARATAEATDARRALTTAVVVALLFWLAVLAVTWVTEKVVASQQLGWPPPAEVHQPWVWGSVNTPPVLVLLLAPFIAWVPRRALRRSLSVIALASAAVVVPLSVGRSAWLGIAVAVLAAEVLLGYPALRRLGLRSRVAARVMGGAVGAVLLAGVALVASGRFEGVTTQLESRIRLWDQAIRLFSAEPLTGAGPSTFGWARLSHVADYVDRVAAKDAHSVPLQTLADGGVLLAGAFVVMAIAWATTLVDRWESVDRGQRIAIAVLCGYAAFALLDDLAFLPVVTVLLIFIAAWALPPAPAAANAPRWRRMVVPVALSLAVIVATPAVLGMTLSRLDAATGRDAAIRGDWATAMEAFDRATHTHPRNAQVWMSLGLAAAHAGHTGDAIAAYERARSISPGDPRPWGALAALSTDEVVSTELLDTASRRSNDPRYSYRLGTRYELRGDHAAAFRSYAIAVALWPDWFAVVPETQQDDVASRLASAVARVGSIGGANPREALWNAHLIRHALPRDASEPWRAVLAAVNGDIDGARRLLQAAASSPRADLAAAAVARFACNRSGLESADMRLAIRPPADQPGDHPVAIGPPGVYREPELGDYQPIEGRSVPPAPAWPIGLVEVPDCGW